MLRFVVIFTKPTHAFVELQYLNEDTVVLDAKIKKIRPVPKTLYTKGLRETITSYDEGGVIMNIRGLNHLTFSVANLDRSIHFYKTVFGAKLLVKGHRIAYFDLNGLWVALNVEKSIPRNEIHHSYTHIAISIDEMDFYKTYKRLKDLNVNILSSRPRDKRDKKSIYFTDPDGHKFEFHTGSLQDRLNYYKEEKRHMAFYD